MGVVRVVQAGGALRHFGLERFYLRGMAACLRRLGLRALAELCEAAAKRTGRHV